MGNPLSYYNGQSYIFTWQEGRELASAAIGDSTYTYKYNQDGIRVEKTVGTKKYEYTLDGSKIVRERILSNNVPNRDSYFYYDANGHISSANIFVYASDGTYEYTFVFRTNIQGDVVEILDTEGVTLVTYQYDAYGNFIENIEAEQNINLIASQTPFKYRGYIYDQETGLYYLNSRYYDPKVGRFINADDIGYLGANGDLQAFNLFAYCSNNPVMYVDNEGDSATAILGAAIASTPIGALLFLGIVAMSAILSGVKEEAKSESKAENDITEEKLKLDIALEKNNRRKIVFPQNPFEFKPLGLVMKVHPGTKNGRVISWIDPIKNEEVFRWDENINVSNGPHYHINNIIFAGIHFYAYDKIPEPYRTIYFSFLK